MLKPAVLGFVASGALALVTLPCSALPIANISVGPKATSVGSSIELALINSVQEQLARLMDLPASSFSVEVENLRLNPEISRESVTSVQVLGLGSNGAKRLDGLFSLPIIVQRKTGSAQAQATGLLKVTGPVYVARKTLVRGQILTQNDLNLTTLPWKTLPTGAAAESWPHLVGLRVKSHIESGDAVFASQLEEPLDVQSGDLVELTLLSGPGVMIRSRAVAKQEGRVGDFIRLEQPDTKKALSGFVVGKKSVEVRL